MQIAKDSGDHVRRIAWLAEQHLWTAMAHETDFPGSVDLKVAESLGEPPHVNGKKAADLFDTPITLTFRTAKEIAESTPPEIGWTIYGIAADRSITEVVASIKAGKSTFIGHAVAAVLHGQPFLGQATRKGPVIWLTEERPTTFRRLLERTGLLAEEDLLCLALQDARGSAWADMVTAAVAMAIKIKAVLLVVDTIGRLAGLAGDSENDAGAAQAAMAPIENAAASGLSVIIGRHARKAGGDPESVGRGSSAWSGVSDIVIQLVKPGASHPPNVRKVNSVSRFEETPDEVLIQLDEDGYRLLGSEAAVATSDAEAVYLEALREAGGEVSQVDLLKLSDLQGEPIARGTGLKALGNLALFHRVERLGVGGRKNPFVWSLIEASFDMRSTGHVGVDLISSEVEVGAVDRLQSGQRPPTEGDLTSDLTSLKPQKTCPSCGASNWYLEADERHCRNCQRVWTP